MAPGKPPPVWDEATLAADRLQSIANFVGERSAEGGALYQATLARTLADVETLFRESDELRALGTGAVLAAHPALASVARYLCGPPISADDLNTIAGAKLATRARLSQADAARIEQVILAGLDRARFPWLLVAPERPPTAAEREVAVHWTAGLKATQEVATGRRTESARRQQEAVRGMLTRLGFWPVPRRVVDSVRDLQPGQYVPQETRVRGTNCDVAVAMWDGRLLLMECKVSNSGVNSYKRLIHECGQKADAWRREFGNQAITAAVLSGVFELRNLIAAQVRGAPVVLFWEHRLDALEEFLKD